MINAIISTKKVKYKDIIKNLVSELYDFYSSSRTRLNVYIDDNNIGVTSENNQYIKSLFREYSVCQFIPRNNALIFNSGTDQVVPKNIREIYEDFNCDIQSWVNFKDKDKNVELASKKVTVYTFLVTILFAVITGAWAIYQHFDSKHKDDKIEELGSTIENQKNKILKMDSIIIKQSKEITQLNQKSQYKILPNKNIR